LSAISELSRIGFEESMSEATLTLSDPEVVLQLFGPQDSNLRQVRNQLGVAITHRGGQIRVSGESESVRLATEILEVLKERAYRNGHVSPDEVAEQLGRVSGAKGFASLRSIPPMNACQYASCAACATSLTPTPYSSHSTNARGSQSRVPDDSR
jgi:hypothetical protein